MEILKDNPQYAEVVNDNEAARLYELQTQNGGAYEGWQQKLLLFETPTFGFSVKFISSLWSQFV